MTSRWHAFQLVVLCLLLGLGFSSAGGGGGGDHLIYATRQPLGTPTPSATATILTLPLLRQAFLRAHPEKKRWTGLDLYHFCKQSKESQDDVELTSMSSSNIDPGIRVSSGSNPVGSNGGVGEAWKRCFALADTINSTDAPRARLLFMYDLLQYPEFTVGDLSILNFILTTTSWSYGQTTALKYFAAFIVRPKALFDRVWSAFCDTLAPFPTLPNECQWSLIVRQHVSLDSNVLRVAVSGYSAGWVSAEKEFQTLNNELCYNSLSSLSTAASYHEKVYKALKHGATIHSNCLRKFLFGKFSRKKHENPSRDLGQQSLAEDLSSRAKRSSGSTPNRSAIAFLQQLLQYGMALNYEFDSVPLLYAVEHEEVMRILLEAGANHELNYHSLTAPPLIEAAYAGKVNQVTLLLEYGADSNIQSALLGLTPLMVTDSPEVARLLLEHDADVNAKDKQGITSLFYATALASAEVTEILVDYGANVKENGNDFAMTPLMNARTVEAARCLLNRDSSNINALDVKNYTALLYAAARSNSGVVSLLISNGANVNHREYRGKTALLLTASAHVAHILLEEGHANPNIQDNEGNSPLMYAASRAASGIVNELVSHGASCELRNRKKRSVLDIINGLPKGLDEEKANILLMLPLEPFKEEDTFFSLVEFFKACSIGRTEKVAAYLMVGMDANAVLNDHTPLMVTGVASVASILLQKGASVSATNSAGETPLFLAVRHGFFRVVQLLVAHNASVTIVNHIHQTLLMVCHSADIMKTLYPPQKVNWLPSIINAQDHHGDSALHYALQRPMNHLEIVQFLITNGIDVNLSNVNGTTALMLASSGPVVKALLHSGASPIATDNMGSSALMHIFRHSTSLEMLKDLLDAGADVKAFNQHGQSVFMMAKSWDVLSYLLAHDPSLINRQDASGYSALHYAVNRELFLDQTLNRVRVLLKYGCDVNLQDGHGRTALMLAKDMSIIRTLLLPGQVQLHLRDRQGYTALSYAIVHGNLNAVQMLLKNKADVSIQDEMGRNALALSRTLMEKSAAHRAIYDLLSIHSK